MDKPVIRWTIGPVKPAGFHCLKQSVKAFQLLYPECSYHICHNGLTQEQLLEITDIGATLINQEIMDIGATPIGVAWKLYPSRLNIGTHEIFIDNDLVIEQPIPEIDNFLQSDSTMLLEETSCHYGRFERHVPPGYKINSGFFGIPPGFDLQKYISFYGNHWEENAMLGHELSRTMDEQGLVAMALLEYSKFIIIPKETITSCITKFVKGKGMHFIGLNRSINHVPYREYRLSKIKSYL